MKSQIEPKKLTRNERFRICCPELYAQIVREKVEKLPLEKQNLFYRLALLNNELQYVRSV
jgi:hypothetical protein